MVPSSSTGITGKSRWRRESPELGLGEVLKPYPEAPSADRHEHRQGGIDGGHHGRPARVPADQHQHGALPQGETALGDVLRGGPRKGVGPSRTGATGGSRAASAWARRMPRRGNTHPRRRPSRTRWSTFGACSDSPTCWICPRGSGDVRCRPHARVLHRRDRHRRQSRHGGRTPAGAVRRDGRFRHGADDRPRLGTTRRR